MKCGDIARTDTNNNQIDLKEPKGDFKSFWFDKVLDKNST